MKNIRKRISKKITKALAEFQLIEPGDRVLVAASGGKDSTTLLLELAARMGRVGPPHELAAVHIQNDFASTHARDFLKTLSQQIPIPFHFLDIAVAQRVKEGHKLSCYWCSNQRRLELLEFARTHGYNKIALGHHMDDAVETLLMNMLYNAKIAGMPAKIPYDKYPITLIRPLIYCEEHEIQSYVDESGYAQHTCSCEFGKNSHRKRIRQEIASLTQESSTLKQNLFHSMRNIRQGYLV